MHVIVRNSLKFLAVVIAFVITLVLYNYLRFIVFWSPTENVAFTSEDGTRLSGTLVKPSDEGIFPAVVMLHGSGPESMDGPSYHVIANTIVRSGFAVLLYDKRGVGASAGDFDTALYRDFVADAVAAVDYLATRDDIDTSGIGVQGNSESGWLTPEVAHTTRKVAFVFNRVGSPLSWVETVLWEVRNDFLSAGIADSDVDELVAVTRRRWNYYIAAGNDSDLADGAERDAVNAELTLLRSSVPNADNVLPESIVSYDADAYAAYAADLSYDPGPFLEAIDIPMIYTFGETDINIPTSRSVEFLETFRQQYDKDIDIVVFEGVGHPMANWSGAFTAGYVPAYLELVESWYGEQAFSQANSQP